MCQATSVGGVVEPAALPGRMGQRNDDRSLAEAPADSVLQAPCAEKARDRELSDRNDDDRPEHLQLGVEPVRAVGDSRGWRAQVARTARMATGKAAHERADVGQ